MRLRESNHRRCHSVAEEAIADVQQQQLGVASATAKDVAQMGRGCVASRAEPKIVQKALTKERTRNVPAPKGKVVTAARSQELRLQQLRLELLQGSAKKGRRQVGSCRTKNKQPKTGKGMITRGGVYCISYRPFPIRK